MSAIFRRVIPYVIVALVCVAVTSFFMYDFMSSATAQQTGTQSRIVLETGTLADGLQPLFVIDSVEQVILVYEYDYDKFTLTLRSVRSYQYDKYLKEYNTLPKLKDVVMEAQKQKPPVSRTRRMKR